MKLEPFISLALSRYLEIRREIGTNKFKSESETAAQISKSLERALQPDEAFFLIPFTTDSKVFFGYVNQLSVRSMKSAYNMINDSNEQIMNRIDAIANSEKHDLALYIAVVSQVRGKMSTDYVEEANVKIEEWKEYLKTQMSIYLGLIRKLGEAFDINGLSQSVEKKCEEVLGDSSLKLVESSIYKKLETTLSKFPDVVEDKSLTDVMQLSDFCDGMMKGIYAEINKEVPVSFSMEYMLVDYESRL